MDGSGGPGGRRHRHRHRLRSLAAGLAPEHAAASAALLLGPPAQRVPTGTVTRSLLPLPLDTAGGGVRRPSMRAATPACHDCHWCTHRDTAASARQSGRGWGGAGGGQNDSVPAPMARLRWASSKRSDRGSGWRCRQRTTGWRPS